MSLKAKLYRFFSLFAIAVMSVASFSGNALAVTINPGDLVFAMYGNSTQFIQDLGPASTLLAPGTTTFTIDPSTLSAVAGSNPVDWALIGYNATGSSIVLLAGSSIPPSDYTPTQLSQVTIANPTNVTATWEAQIASEGSGSQILLPASDPNSFTSRFGTSGSLAGGFPVAMQGVFGSTLYIISGDYNTNALTLLGQGMLSGDGSQLMICSPQCPMATTTTTTSPTTTTTTTTTTSTSTTTTTSTTSTTTSPTTTTSTTTTTRPTTTTTTTTTTRPTTTTTTSTTTTTRPTTTTTTSTTTTTRPTTTTTTSTTTTTRPTTTTTTSTTTTTRPTTTTTTTTSTTTTTIAGALPDVGVVKFKGPDTVKVGQNPTVGVVVKDFGKGKDKPQTRSLSLTLNGVPVSGSPVSVTLKNGQQMTLNFKVHFITPGTATLEASLSPTDSNPANDTLTKTVVVK